MPVSDRVTRIARIDAHFACAQLACAYGLGLRNLPIVPVYRIDYIY
jgi:hypothetical protein